MNEGVLEKAVRDLEGRTLKRMNDLSKLVYLASTRDYNTGRYHHDGLAQTYAAEIAESALKHCHASVFRHFVENDIETLVGDIHSYLAEIRGDPVSVLKAWRLLEPFRILVPANCDPHMRDLFASNFSIALRIVSAKLYGG